MLLLIFFSKFTCHPADSKNHADEKKNWKCLHHRATGTADCPHMKPLDKHSPAKSKTSTVHHCLLKYFSVIQTRRDETIQSKPTLQCFSPGENLKGNLWHTEWKAAHGRDQLRRWKEERIKWAEDQLREWGRSTEQAKTHIQTWGHQWKDHSNLNLKKKKKKTIRT